MRTLDTALLIASACLLASPAVCQRLGRSAFADDPPAWITYDGNLVYDWAATVGLFDPEPAPSSLATGVDFPGDVRGWSSGTPDVPISNFLVTGRLANGDAIIQHYTWNPDGTSVPQLATCFKRPGGDFASGDYDPASQRLYVFDSVGKRIQRCSWDGVGAIPSTGWTVVVTDAEVPELANPAHSLDVFVSSGVAKIRVSRHVATAEELFARVNAGIKLIDDNVAPPTVSALTQVPIPTPTYAMVTHSLKEGGTTVSVQVGAGEAGTFELYDADSSQLLGSTTASGLPQPTEIQISSSQAFTIGTRYVVKRQNEPLNAYWASLCYARYGAPETTPNGTKIGRLYHVPDFELGSEYSVFVPVATSNELIADPDGAVPFDGVVGFAARDPVTGADPVLQVGNNWVLQASLFLQVDGLVVHIGPNGVEGETLLTGFSLSIPNDSALMVLLTIHDSLEVVESQNSAR